MKQLHIEISGPDKKVLEFLAKNQEVKYRGYAEVRSSHEPTLLDYTIATSDRFDGRSGRMQFTTDQIACIFPDFGEDSDEIIRDIPVVYVCGPFTAETSWGIENNIRRAEEVAHHLWLSGAAVICPHTNTRFFHGEMPHERWIQGDLAIIRGCDAVFLMPGYLQSRGSIRELGWARKHNIPTFEVMRDVKDFIRGFRRDDRRPT